MTTNQTHKSYNVDYEKLKYASTQELASFFGTLVVRDDYEYFDDVKHLLDIPEEPKGLEYYQQELEEKFDEILAKTKIKFDVSKQSAEYRYNRKFDSINNNLKYALKNGSFPPILTIGTGDGCYLVSTGSSLEWATSFNLKNGEDTVGYWSIKPNIKVHLDKKPNPLVRWFSSLLLDFKWVDS